MVVEVSLHDNSNNQSIVLSDPVTVIGRGFFECQDKRVSKKHGEITIIDATVKVKSIHTNPIFYKLKNDPATRKVLWKDNEVTLGDLDKFSLLPDEYEWTIKVKNDTPTFRIRETAEINANLTQLLRDDQATPDLEMTPSPENLRAPAEYENDTEVPKEEATVSTSSVSRKRSFENTDGDAGTSESVEPKKMKPVPSSENVTQQSTDMIPPENIKPDPDSTEAINSNMPATSVSNVKEEPVDSTEQPSSSADPTTTTTVKTENEDDACCQNSNRSLRPSCEFGIRCYRMTDEHRREYAHPMDCDYRRPNFPSAPPDAPRCPYWDGCYRRNPEHFREMAHPPADQYVTQRPPTIQVVTHQVIQIQPRSRNTNRARNDDFDDEEFEEEDSDEDMFHDSDDTDMDQDFIVGDSQSISEDELDDEENNLEE